MKTQIKCKLYTFLFRVLPIPAWQVFLIKKHLDTCPHCREAAANDEHTRKMLVSPDDTKTLPALWPYVSQHMDDAGDSPAGQPFAKPGFSLVFKWQWQVATVGTLLLLGIVFVSLFLDKKQSPVTEELSITGSAIPIDQADQVVVKSVKIGSEAAKYYFFQSKDPDKVIVWTQKK